MVHSYLEHHYTPNSVLVVVELSAATLPFVSHLQNCLRLLLLEQVARTEEFNIMRSGDMTHCYPIANTLLLNLQNWRRELFLETQSHSKVTSVSQ